MPKITPRVCVVFPVLLFLFCSSGISCWFLWLEAILQHSFRNNLSPKKVSSLTLLSLDESKFISVLKFHLPCSAKILYYNCSHISNIDKAPFLHRSNYPSISQTHLCCFLHLLTLYSSPVPILCPHGQLNVLNNQLHRCLSLHLPKSSAIKAPKPPSLCLIKVLLSVEWPHTFLGLWRPLPQPPSSPAGDTRWTFSLHHSKPTTFQRQQRARDWPKPAVCH